MGFEFAAEGLVVGFIVVVSIAEQHTTFGAVEDKPEVQVYACGPEIAVFGFLDAVELKARVSGVELEVEGSGFDEALLIAGEAGQAVLKYVGDAEFHRQ